MKRVALLVACSTTALLQCSVLAQAAADVPMRGIEIRWFFDGHVPASVAKWFELDSRLGTPLSDDAGEKRVDTYLLAENSAVPVSIKMSRGNLELKFRQGATKLSVDGSNVQGFVETWHKWQWRYGTSNGDPVAAAFVKDSVTRPIDKRRLQRKFSVENDQVEPTPVRLETRVDRGCAVELAHLNADGNTSWTLAVESLGSTDSALLNRCLHFILQDYAGPPLRLGNSYSYPVWLMKYRATSK